MFFIKEKALVGSCAICVKTVTHFSLFDTDLTHFLHYTALYFALKFILFCVDSKIAPILMHFSDPFSGAFLCTLLSLMAHTTACMFAVFSSSSGCSVRILSPNQPQPTCHWQWHRSARTSRWSAFHWTWGLESSGPLLPQRPIQLTQHT